MDAYDLRSVELPRLTGPALELLAGALERGPTRALLLPKLLRDAGVEKLRALRVEAPPTFLPLSSDTRAAGRVRLPALEHISVNAELRAPLARVRDYADAYRRGETTPDQVAERLLAAVEASRAQPRPLGAVLASDEEDVRAMARASTARWAAGRPLGVLDGVPVGIKDELDQRGYVTTVGTRFMGRGPAAGDATVVLRLRQAGALLFGKLSMNEIGVNPNGGNMNHGLTRNPHDLTRDTGGSSSGSAAAVAAGLCPIAIGADGGGSVRIPAALCGVAGLKATFGRVSEHGAAPLCWSVAHVGPLAATIEDLAIAYAVIAGPDASDPGSLAQPPPSLEGLDAPEVQGLRIGIYRPWFEHAAPEVVARAAAAVDALVARGARVVEVELPRLDAARTAHALTILSEMAASMARYREDGAEPALTAPSRINLALGRAFTSSDYVLAQQVRTEAIQALLRAFERADVIATPTTAITAPKLPVTAAKDGWSDLESVTEVMRYAFLGNLTGVPALTVPAGFDAAGLPVGVQLMARPWAEHVLFRAAAVVEAAVTDRRRAKLWFDVLGGRPR